MSKPAPKTVMEDASPGTAESLDAATPFDGVLQWYMRARENKVPVGALYASIAVYLSWVIEAIVARSTKPEENAGYLLSDIAASLERRIGKPVRSPAAPVKGLQLPITPGDLYVNSKGAVFKLKGAYYTVDHPAPIITMSQIDPPDESGAGILQMPANRPAWGGFVRIHAHKGDDNAARSE
jgi:hypothetical protein